MISSGTTLIVARTRDSIVMAADDLGHSQTNGVIVPRERGIKKLLFLDDHIVIGSYGLMRHFKIKYTFEEWISVFEQTQYGALADRNPHKVAAALERHMKETFDSLEAASDNKSWKLDLPIGRLVTYIVAGYDRDRQSPHIFEFGAKLTANERHVEYDPAIRYRSSNPIIFGEQNFLRRAQLGLEPEGAYWQSIVTTLDIGAALPGIPRSLRHTVASIVGLIKVESEFNKDKVGANVRVGVLCGTSGTSFVANL